MSQVAKRKTVAKSKPAAPRKATAKPTKSPVKKTGRKKIRHAHLRFAALMIFCAGLLAMSAILSLKVRSTKQVAVNRPVSKTEAAQGGLEMYLIGATTDAEGIPRVWVPGGNEHFVMVELKAVNKSDMPVYISPVTMVTLLDESGTEYKATAAPNMKTGLGGPVGPRQTAQGQVGFQVPRDKTYRLQLSVAGIKKTVPLNLSPAGTN